MISIYTDGSSAWKAGNGGWAFVALRGSEVAEMYGYEDNTTISVMELRPLKNALSWIPVGPTPLRIFCDSQYAVNAVNVWGLEWKANGGRSANGKPPKHWKLIEQIIDLLAEHRKHRAVTILWIPGHSKHEHNERADFLAGYARKNKATNWASLVKRAGRE